MEAQTSVPLSRGIDNQPLLADVAKEEETEMERWVWIGPLVVLAGAIGLLQAHGMAFWSAELGPYGIAWSVLLEATALWLWWGATRTRRGLGLVASTLLLLGPLYQVVTPVLDGMAEAAHEDRAREERVPAVKSEIARLEGQVATFTENSAKRPGWLPAIEAAEARLREAREELTALIAKAPQSTVRMETQRMLVIGMECMGLVLFQVTAVLAIAALSERARARKACVAGQGTALRRSALVARWPVELISDPPAAARPVLSAQTKAKAPRTQSTPTERTEVSAGAHAEHERAPIRTDAPEARKAPVAAPAAAREAKEIPAKVVQPYGARKRIKRAPKGESRQASSVSHSCPPSSVDMHSLMPSHLPTGRARLPRSGGPPFL
jgi:hypothetical protein